MTKVIFKICVLALFTIPFMVTSCDSEDIVISAKGINSDSTIVHIPYTGSRTSYNYVTVTSLNPWSVEFEKPSEGSWLTDISPSEGDRTTIVELRGETNTWRRRSTRLIFRNEFATDTVIVVQKAEPDYEPGIVVYYENFGTDTVRTTTPTGDYSKWGARGTGVSTISYRGTDAYIQSEVRDTEYEKQPHEELSGVNNLLLQPDGEIILPRLNKADTLDNFFLTLYVASYSAGSYLPMQPNSLYIDGSTDDKTYNRIPMSITTASGWQKIEVEFRTIELATNFYIKITNSGTQPIYIDDVTLETGGKGTQIVGTPTPVVTTIAATDITSTTGQVGIRYAEPEGITVTRAGIQWRKADEADYEQELEIENFGPDTDYPVVLENLEPGERYYYRAFTVHGDDIYTYGNELSFTTPETEGRRR